jgi:hypothetical protein
MEETMQHKILPVLVTTLFCSTSMAEPVEVNMNPGLWEWTAEVNIPNMPKQIPPTVNKKCLTKKDLVPTAKQPGQECDIKELETSRESVSWAMTCTSPRGPIASTGKMFYNGDTAHGDVKVNTQGMLMTSKMKGKRLGPCEEPAAEEKK